jgi:hypothetical protein
MSRNSLVSKWLANAMRSGRFPGIVATTFAIETSPSGVLAMKICWRASMPTFFSSDRMYSRVCWRAADPDGRGPSVT